MTDLNSKSALAYREASKVKKADISDAQMQSTLYDN